MVFLPKIIPRVPSHLSLRFKPSEFKYSVLEFDNPSSPIERRGCSQRLKWKTMSMKMRIATVTLLVGICVAIQLTIILLIRGYYRRSHAPSPEVPEHIKYPWRFFPEDNWKPVVQDHHEAYFHEPYDHLNLRNACPGPDGKTFPFQKYYTTTPATHPIPQLGSYELLNLSQPCMSYYQRYNPYIDISTSTNWSQYLNQCFKMQKKEQRSVIVMRAWQGYQWHRDDILNLRALIIELGLNTGGLFDIRILLEVKDGSAFLASEKEAQRVIDTVPEEFRSLVHLWSENEMHGYYPGLNSVLDGNVIHAAYRGLFMALQKFAVEHSEYDYFYNWEMDIRYTGNYYEFFSKTNTWARKEPYDPTMRRSQKYYIPEIHNWTSPPVPDDEEADLIQYGPIFDQIGSKWNFEKDVVGYENGTDTPRRAVIISASRLSRRLLLMMNHVNAELKSSVAPEAFPATVALHYGMKAIFVPHPVFIDKPWPPRMLDEWFNAIDMFREENMFEGISWYYRTHHAPDIYYRWRNDEKKEAVDEICRWPLLLHPIKDVRDVVPPAPPTPDEFD